MVESDILEMLRDNGKTVYIHTIVGGGDTMADTANGFNAIVKGIGIPLSFYGSMNTLGNDYS